MVVHDRAKDVPVPLLLMLVERAPMARVGWDVQVVHFLSYLMSLQPLVVPKG